MSLPARRATRTFLPDVGDFLGSFPTITGLRPMVDAHAIRVEDEIEDGRYVVRAEIPGIDPDKEVDITVHSGVLTIEAERSERTSAKGHSEFRYGSFSRSVTLPAGADEDSVSAEYVDGILTVTVALGEASQARKHVSIKHGKDGA